MQALELLQLVKCTSQDGPILNSLEIKLVALAIIKLRLLEGNSQSVGRSVENSVKLEIFISSVEGFMVDLKTFLSLAMPNQSCLDVKK